MTFMGNAAPALLRASGLSAWIFLQEHDCDAMREEVLSEVERHPVGGTT
jgi:hypothetical protein